MSPRVYSIYVDRILKADNDLLEKEVERLKNENSNLEKENEELRISRSKNYIMYLDEKGKVYKLENKIKKLKEKLGLIPKEKKKINKLNSYGFYTAEYCKTTKKPMFQANEYEPFKDVLLSKTRCKEIKKPVIEGENIYAFLRVMHGYCALYYRKK